MKALSARGTSSQGLDVPEPTLAKLLRLVTKSRRIATRVSPEAYSRLGTALQ